MTRIKNKKWIIAEPNKDFQDFICHAYQISPYLGQVLFNRNLIDPEKVDKFLRASLKNLSDPRVFNNMERVVLRTYEAILRNEKISVFGDYDVDGITSVALLVHVFKSYGIDITYYIPHREKEGYGLSIEGIKSLHKEKTTLLFTVDCGTTSINEIAYAKSLGIDVIVLDHHEPQNKLPDCVGIINPKLENSNYTLSTLAGVGVVFKFLHALNIFLKEEDFPQAKDLNLATHLDIVSLGTLADMMPLHDENRIFVKKGLQKLSESPKIGIQALISKIGKMGEPISEQDVCFKIAPRINAIGRLGDPSLAVRLLTTSDEKEAQFLAETLENHNKERQNIEQEILAGALQSARDMDDDIIVLVGEKWHVGVIGIVASKIVSDVGKPSIVITLDDDLGRGSGRSINNFPLLDSLCYCKHLLQNFGGHDQAAGITIYKDNIDEFRKRINEFAAQNYLSADKTPELLIDSEIDLAFVNNDFIAELKSLSPFGQANPQPVFAAKNLTLAEPARIVGEHHLKLRVCQNGTVIDAIGFGFAPYADLLKNRASGIDLAFYPQLNTFRNQTSVQLVIKDIKVS